MYWAPAGLSRWASVPFGIGRFALELEAPLICTVLHAGQGSEFPVELGVATVAGALTSFIWYLSPPSWMHSEIATTCLSLLSKSM